MNPLNSLWTWLRAAAVGLAVAALAGACGGGGGVGSGGTGSFAAGPVTGFGSVIVNDIHFDDTAAVIEDGDGVRHTRDDLKLGMTVEIDSGPITPAAGGASASASAGLIRYDSELRGPVTATDSAGNAFSALGQQVVVDPTTVFDSSLGTLAALRAGTAVEVYAVYDPAAAQYRAKRVAPAASGASTQLRGVVSAIDAAGRTLTIGNSTYAYGSAGSPPGDLAVGGLVRVVVAPVPASGRWTVLSFGTALPVQPDASGASVDGLISSFASATRFSVGGRPVDATAANFPDGRSGLGLGVRVVVQGTLRNGTLQATQVQIRSDEQEEEDGFELQGAIVSVDAAAQTFVVRGVTVSTARPGLQYQGGSAADLVAGRRVSVQGQLADDRSIIAATLIDFD